MRSVSGLPRARSRPTYWASAVVVLLVSVTIVPVAGLAIPGSSVDSYKAKRAATEAADPVPPVIREWAAVASLPQAGDPVPRSATGAGDTGEGLTVTVAAGQLDKLLADKGLSPTRIFRSAVQGFTAALTAEQVMELKSDTRVVSISEPQVVSGFSQAVPPLITRINADEAPVRAGTGLSDSSGLPGVAVVDSGVEFHPDLNVVEQINCSSETSATDLGGHGTGVAGVLAARDDDKGTVGVAPGAPVYSVKVMNKSNQGTIGTLVCGLDWISAHAAEKNIKVVNLSLGVRGADDGNCGIDNSDPVHMAVCSLNAKGVTVIASAGHISADLAGVIPAAYDEVLTATNMADWDGKPGGLGTPPCNNQTSWLDDRPASDTNFAVSAEDIAHTVAAPGACPYTTLRGARYGYLAGGTSMSAAATSGVVLNCLRPGGTCVGKTPAEIRRTVIDQAKNATLSSDHGYLGDPRTVSGRYYGWLVTAGPAPALESSPPASTTPSPTPAPSTEPPPTEPEISPPAADVTAPTVKLVSPGPGARVAGTVQLQASATDESGVAAVTFYLGDAEAGAGTLQTDGSWQATLDTTGFANDAYVLRAVAVDDAGNAGSGSHKIRIDNTVPAPPPADTAAPTVSIANPLNGARVSGSVPLVAQAADDVGVTGVNFWVHTTLIGTGTVQPDGTWRTTVSTVGYPNGLYYITAKATDSAGNIGISQQVTVEVAN